MTTYNSYEAAKIANPECDIYTACGGFYALGGVFTVIASESLVLCNPADYCMTVEKFLTDGYKLAEGDVYLNIQGDVRVVNSNKDWIDVLNGEFAMDNKRYILRAAALEEKYSEKVEWVNGDACRYNGINWLFCGFHPTNGLAIVANNDSPALHQLVAVDIELLSKPETKQQREERERLEAAYDLYCEWRGEMYESFDAFKRCNHDNWLSIVDKTKYRISK